MATKFGMKFRYPGVTKGKPVTIIYANEELRARRMKSWEEQGATIVSVYEVDL